MRLKAQEGAVKYPFFKWMLCILQEQTIIKTFAAPLHLTLWNDYKENIIRDSEKEKNEQILHI